MSTPGAAIFHKAIQKLDSDSDGGDGNATLQDLQTLNLDMLGRIQNFDELGVLLAPLANLRSLSAQGLFISSLQGLPLLSNLKKLELSDNRISGDLDILVKNTPGLKNLLLSNNLITSIDALIPLGSLSLVNLDLAECPVSKSVPNFRERVFQLIPSLEFLDGVHKNGNQDKEYISSSDEEEEEEEEEEEYEEEEEEEDDYVIRPEEQLKNDGGEYQQEDGESDEEEENNSDDDLREEEFREQEELPNNNNNSSSSNNNNNNNGGGGGGGGDEEEEDLDEVPVKTLKRKHSRNKDQFTVGEIDRNNTKQEDPFFHQIITYSNLIHDKSGGVADLLKAISTQDSIHRLFYILGNLKKQTTGVIAYCLIREDDDKTEILQLFTLQRHRGRGIGAHLVNHAIELTTERSVDRVEAIVVDPHVQKNFYCKFWDFRPVAPPPNATNNHPIDFAAASTSALPLAGAPAPTPTETNPLPNGSAETTKQIVLEDDSKDRIRLALSSKRQKVQH